MKRNIKVILSLGMLVVLFMFCFSNCVYADVVVDGPYDPDFDIDDVSNTTLLKIIIVLLTIILFMGIFIVKFLNNKYQLEVRVKKRDDQVANMAAGSVSVVGASGIDNVEKVEGASEVPNGENIANNAQSENKQPETTNNNSDVDENIKLELDMRKLFAGMFIIVAVLIIVGIIF